MFHHRFKERCPSKTGVSIRKYENTPVTSSALHSDLVHRDLSKPVLGVCECSPDQLDENFF